jgi:UDP-glucuronate 4-epimerase
MIFANSISNHLPLNIYGSGIEKRDYTFVDDVVTVINKLIIYFIGKQAKNEIFNLGSSKPVSLIELITKLENELRIETTKNFLHARAEEMENTFADCTKLEKYIGYKPDTSFDAGIRKFVQWHNTKIQA